MIYVFLGKDINILNSKIEKLISSLKINNIIKYDFNEIDFVDILNEVNYVDLFNEKKLVIVSSFSFKKLDSDDESKLIKYIDNMSENVIILRCIDDSLDERKKITKLLKEKCKVTICEKMDYRALHAYLEDMFKELDINITYDQITRLMFLCDNNVDLSINESNKLVLYKGKHSIVSNDDIEKVIFKSNEKEIFVFNERILNKNIVGALESYNILSVNTDEFQIIDSMARQFRLLLQTKYWIKEKNYKDIARMLGVNEYVIQKLIPFVDKYKEKDIIDMLYRISLLDTKIKIEGYDKREVLETFILSI